jgi:hypothetical protein
VPALVRRIGFVTARCVTPGHPDTERDPDGDTNPYPHSQTVQRNANPSADGNAYRNADAHQLRVSAVRFV